MPTTFEKIKLIDAALKKHSSSKFPVLAVQQYQGKTNLYNIIIFQTDITWKINVIIAYGKDYYDNIVFIMSLLFLLLLILLLLTICWW